MELVDDGYRLDKLRAAVSDERYRIIPPVWADLDVNPNHKPPLEVEGQAGPPKKGKRQTKRRKSNGEFSTSSRVYALHQARSNGEGTAVSASVAAAAAARALSQSQGAGDA